MSPQRSNSRSCRPASRSTLRNGRNAWTAAVVAGAWLWVSWSACLAHAAASLAAPTPPPAPSVPPVICLDDSADRNGNRIDDALEAHTGARRGLALASAPELIAVELIFREPVTQRQIDDFLRLGGRIAYLYRAVSYGWNGLIPAQNVALLPSAMGSTLVRVEEAEQMEPYLDRATQVGRVRLVWKPGFAGSSTGFSGDPNTTIAFLGSGADTTHTDLQNRCSYWKDFTDENQPTPVDYSGHDTAVISVAVGTGAAGGANAGPLSYTETSASPGPVFFMAPFSLPPSYSTPRTIKTRAFWTGDMGGLCHMTWRKGTDMDSPAIFGSYLWEQYSSLTLTNTTPGADQDVYGGLLECVSGGRFDSTGKLKDVILLTTITPYPAVGDGYNRFQGVAPNCRWCAAKVYSEDGYATTHDFAAGLDDLVLHRVEKNIKIVNVSHGLKSAYGLPGESSSVRSKINSAVQNGIVVVAAAGNGAEAGDEMAADVADPGRAAAALTAGAVNDEGALTAYSTYGFLNPRSSAGEDFKPDVLAPGGSWYYTAIFTAESNTSDGKVADKVPNDYTNISGTSLSAAFVSGCAALVIDALQQRGVAWTFASSEQPRYVKMLLCATASETNAQRESRQLNPTLDRAGPSPEGFPAGKDRQEGYGLLNPDAAVEAVSQTYTSGTSITGSLGGDATAKRVWACTVSLEAGRNVTVSLTNAAGADFDLYLYSAVPSETGAPVILASSTTAKAGNPESLQYAPTADGAALLVVKRVSGSGAFTVDSINAGPPVANAVQTRCEINAIATITLAAVDDGQPNPPGALSYRILSLPTYGRLELPDGTPITEIPAHLPSNQVVYRPPADWLGQDSFTFCADDGGTAPLAGSSNPATVTVTVVNETTVEYQVARWEDDGSFRSSSVQSLAESSLKVGRYNAAMRFAGIKVPQGATILRAGLKICAYPDETPPKEVTGTIRGEASDNPPPFDDTNHRIYNLNTTAAAQDWGWLSSNPWVANTWYESPDIKKVVQEIVNRSRWAPGNAMVLVYAGGAYYTDRAFWAFDGDPAKAPKLTITYQAK